MDGVLGLRLDETTIPERIADSRTESGAGAGLDAAEDDREPRNCVTSVEPAARERHPATLVSVLVHRRTLLREIRRLRDGDAGARKRQSHQEMQHPKRHWAEAAAI